VYNVVLDADVNADVQIARRVASHLADSISVRRSPREMVNLLLISCGGSDREASYRIQTNAPTHFNGNVETLHLRPGLRLAVAHVHFDAGALSALRSNANQIPLVASAHSCLSVWTSSFNFCSSESTSR
jgi:hypothetical protein